MIKFRVAKILFGLVAIVCLFASCNNRVVFDESQKIDKNGWNMLDNKQFKVNISETDALYSYRFAINLRHTNDYSYNNIFFFVTTLFPDGSVAKKDTIECILANYDGTWKGKGNADIKDNRFWFAQNVKFTQKGEYVFKIEQATKDTILLGIKDIGLHIEKQSL